MANIGILVLVIIVAIGFTLIACYLTYRYITLLIIKKVYDLTLEQRTRISADIIRRTSHIFDGQAELPQTQLRQAVNWSITVHRYYQSIPVFFQSGITQYFNRIPITRFIIDLKEDILADNHQLATEKLRNSIDNFFEKNIIGSPTNLWTWLLWLVNILTLYSLINWGIHSF